MSVLNRKKMRPINDPYEVWVQDSHGGKWEWRILKFYSEKKNDRQRVFVAVKSPFTFNSYEQGDSYYKEIKDNARKVPKKIWSKNLEPA